MLHGIPKKEICITQNSKKEFFILAENEIYVTQVYKKGIRFGQRCPRFLSKKGNFYFYWIKRN